MSLFGTDGVRGKANEVVTPQLAYQIGFAAGNHFRQKGGKRAVIGRDTRRSGSMLGAALASGFAAAGLDVETLGVVPTPCVSFAARTFGFDVAAVISASHNPAYDNGIKLLGADGGKLTTETEEQIEALIDKGVCATGSDIGRITPNNEAEPAYLDWLRSLHANNLNGLKLAIDCANGAAHKIAPKLFAELGAELVLHGNHPDGDNINENCGATDPHVVQSLTHDSGAHLGISFDGDADRCVFSDELGNLINGDKFMAAWALHQSRSGGLRSSVVVGTVMSNSGFEHALSSHGIRLERTDVGDRNVAARIKETGSEIGGEQSGHIIFSDLTPTGDGLLTALQMTLLLSNSGSAASKLEPIFENWPQLMLNIYVSDKSLINSTVVVDGIQESTERLGAQGRILVRPSGTQPMIRVMVEAKEYGLRDQIADELGRLIVQEMKGEIRGRVDLTHALGD